MKKTPERIWKSTLLLLFLIFLQPVYAEISVIKVACIGNSITYGHGIDTKFQYAYPGILQQMLGVGYDVRNFGRNGQTLLLKGDHPYMKTDLYQSVKDFQPDIVTIKLGTNDSKPHNWKYKNEFQDDLETMIEELRSLPSKPKIYLCYPVPTTLPGNKTINDSTIVHGIIPILRKVAKREHLQVIDLHTALADYPQLFPDKLHPNKEGSELIAREIYRVLTGKEAAAIEMEQAFPGVKSKWNGFDRYDFKCWGRNATIVVPKKVASGRPWIWRPAFFGAFPSVDKALLAEGFHVAYYDLTHLYGSPRSMKLGNIFYEVMTRDFHLSPKVTVEGLSRGGYFAFNWAAANSSKVACLYVDAPVCDMTSWPGKKRPDLWKGFLDEWNIADAPSGAAFEGNALHLLPALVKAKIPIIAVCGDADKIVPYDENLKPFREAYQRAGGVIELILKPGCDHHPHSLEDPERVVDFIKRYQVGYTDKQHIHFRSDLSNAFTRFRDEKQGCVAFLGGSITFMKGWKEQVKESLKQRFPDTQFTFIDAGISSAGSTPHAFRLENDVLKKATPDLMFLEAAVNDYTNAFSAVEQVRAMEGIVRHARTVNPKMDLVMMHFAFEPFIPLQEKNIEPDVIMNHERVANWYSISSINLAREITERMMKGELTWKEFGGVHPSWKGHKYYSAAINHLFDVTTHAMNKVQYMKPHPLPKQPLDSCNYDNGCFVDVRETQQLHGFRYVSDWMPSVHKKVTLRPGFHHVPMLEAQRSGDSFRLEFEGKAVGIFCVAGPSACVLEYRIDGGTPRRLNMHTQWSNALYIPWVYMLATELEEGHHVLTARVVKGERTECQIRNFVVNK